MAVSEPNTMNTAKYVRTVSSVSMNSADDWGWPILARAVLTSVVRVDRIDEMNSRPRTSPLQELYTRAVISVCMAHRGVEFCGKSFDTSNIDEIRILDVLWSRADMFFSWHSWAPMAQTPNRSGGATVAGSNESGCKNGKTGWKYIK